jgi:AcrR family transcriptional regulator
MSVDHGEGGIERAAARKPRAGRPRSPAVDEAILEAALELFVERGLDGVGIEQVAERAGVARTTVYRRWPSKESLVAQAIALGRGSADEKVVRDPTSRRSTMKSVAEALARTFGAGDYRKMVARLIGSIPDHPELMAIYSRTYLIPRRKIASDALELARAQGLIREDLDGDILLDLVAGALMYRLLIFGDSSEKSIRGYLLKLLRELRLEKTN